MSLPHIQNSKAGVNRWDPMHNSLFEVYFTLPEALRGEYANDEMLITEHVKSISGLDSLDKGPGAEAQKFMGTSRSYLQPKLDATHHELEVVFTLNLRNGVDNYIYKIFKAWKNLNYNLETGEISLKKDYCADWLKISIANRAGDIIRQIVYKDVMLAEGITGMNDLSYESNDAVELTVKFRSDWAKEVIA
jgi:hypothetical protein